MSFKLLAGLFMLFFLGNMFALFLEGDYIGGTADVTLANQLLGFNVSQLQGPGLLAIPKIGFAVFTNAIPKIVMWDYNFFEGGWAIIQWFLVFTLSAPLLIISTIEFGSALQGVWARFF